MEFLYPIVVIGLLTAGIFLIKKQKEEVERFENEDKKVLKDCVNEVKTEIVKLLTHYPNLDSNIIIEGKNDGHQLTLGNIYAPDGNLTFPLRTPDLPVNTTGGTMSEPLRILLTVHGTVGKYQIVGLAELSDDRTFKVIYSSHLDSFVEGTIHPKK